MSVVGVTYYGLRWLVWVESIFFSLRWVALDWVGLKIGGLGQRIWTNGHF